jgi:hypothetical protein
VKHNFEKYFCIVFVAAMTAMSIANVGEMPKHLDKPYGWSLVGAVLALTGIPALFGYLAGRKDSYEG